MTKCSLLPACAKGKKAYQEPLVEMRRQEIEIEEQPNKTVKAKSKKVAW